MEFIISYKTAKIKFIFYYLTDFIKIIPDPSNNRKPLDSHVNV